MSARPGSGWSNVGVAGTTQVSALAARVEHELSRLEWEIATARMAQWFLSGAGVLFVAVFLMWAATT